MRLALSVDACRPFGRASRPPGRGSPQATPQAAGRKTYPVRSELETITKRVSPYHSLLTGQ
ncbi:MAG: hypothetical protein QME51_07800, partial [Planctomycetota bacterium]|nr:hypothetical protein [Planctomycetota bacterium]MDI6788259.1 hypothetical protein [Planctomycetota bacterium]